MPYSRRRALEGKRGYGKLSYIDVVLINDKG